MFYLRISMDTLNIHILLSYFNVLPTWGRAGPTIEEREEANIPREI